MRRLFNTLFITTQESYLARERETIAIYIGEEKKKFPLHNLDGIICFGNIRLSPYLIGACGEKGITISYLSENGKFLGRFSGKVSGNVLLRRQQYRYADSLQTSAQIAGNMIIGKIFNINSVLKRFLRDHSEKDKKGQIEKTISHLKTSLNHMRKTPGLEIVRGIEGDSAAAYFALFDNLIIQQSEYFTFSGRSRRPPMDKTNALLSFVYTLLYHDMISACESVGLDPAVGFLHRDRPGRNSLSLDLMEEFRPFFADRLVLSLINRQQINQGDFKKYASGAVYMKENSRKTVIEAYQKRKKEIITHPFLKEKMPLGLLFYYQALLLCRFIRGDLDEYPPFLWR
ncbi:CRISPR-associated protein Cas1 [Olavius algarvensis spirochete endosymbiont]|uniref:type I-C CRISPR-associated endonuclease Cas1c n=1 Tax=Olavius algarvensis spirochete endosymbiont TaxID=260710 RepID=UPI000F108392|nr:type I-C CRISPR-associated endonuclease Cas1c [Olavius algarvensis spirochete endosymbiont]VDA98952.1 CRISPR-associated protein Cas1 [Olavius algarvensis spirochete endosymbiont]